ncbi:MAG: nucleoside hydrolase-like domain-containing protein, partial [bacterium]
IATRPVTRSDNPNPNSSGLAILRDYLDAYGQVYSNLIQNNPNYPTKQYLWDKTVAGYNNVDDGVNLIISVVDDDDPRPVWFSNWGCDAGTKSSLWRALDKIKSERGQAGYEAFKNKIRINGDPKFGDHDKLLTPNWKIFTYTKCGTYPCEPFGERWYHRFMPLTYKAGGFNITADVLTNHGPLGALYTIQKEGDTPEFLLVIPNGLCEPYHPQWGGWAGRYGTINNGPYSVGPNYTWPNQKDTWNGSTSRDNTLSRWAVHLQNDFKARMDWCVKAFSQTNHEPVPAVNGVSGRDFHVINAIPGGQVRLSAAGSTDPDGDQLSYEWVYYREAGTYSGNVNITASTSETASLTVPSNIGNDDTIQVILMATDNGDPALTRYRRVLIVKGDPVLKLESNIAPLKKSCIKILPNPFNKYAKLSILETAENQNSFKNNYLIEIQNIKGGIINRFRSLKREIIINDHGLSGGMYVIRVTHDNQTMTAPLLFLR